MPRTLRRDESISNEQPEYQQHHELRNSRSTVIIREEVEVEDIGRGAVLLGRNDQARGRAEAVAVGDPVGRQEPGGGVIQGVEDGPSGAVR